RGGPGGGGGGLGSWGGAGGGGVCCRPRAGRGGGRRPPSFRTAPLLPRLHTRGRPFCLSPPHAPASATTNASARRSGRSPGQLFGLGLLAGRARPACASAAQVVPDRARARRWRL